MKRVYIVLLAVFVFIVITRFVIAESKILINEFLIDPAPQTVELFNRSSESVDISGWYIDDSGGTTYYTIPQSNILYPNACLIFGGDLNLNKSSGDTVRLFSSVAPPTSVSAQLIDSFSYKSSSGSGITYFRLPDGTSTWATGFASFGKYNTGGQSCIIEPTPTPPTATVQETPIIEPSPTVLPSLTPTATDEEMHYSGIYLSEAMINPPPGEHEWIELFNSNDFDVSLKNWQIDDTENGGSSPKQFSVVVLAKQYAVYDLSSSMFNNDMDAIRLLDAEKVLQDSFEYSSTKQGKSYGRITFDNDEFCLQEQSRGLINNPCIDPTPVPIPTQIITPTMSVTHIIQTVTPRNKRGSSIGLFISPQRNQPVGQGTVLGIHAPINRRPNHPIIYLSFTSLSYSLLTIISLLIKMKKGL